jgi:soluble lytic murein transglycosylase-like protein
VVKIVKGFWSMILRVRFRTDAVPTCRRILLICSLVSSAAVFPSHLVEAEKLDDLRQPTVAPEKRANGSPAKMSVRPDPVYDRFLQQFLRGQAAKRQYLAREVSRAAASNHVDPDLLFALIAVESRFDPKAVSSGGARGLGQVLFSTAKAVAPNVVHRPSDLHSVRHNLIVTARYLKELLDEWDGDVRSALLAYRDGPAGPQERGPDAYVNRIKTYVASLKEDREEVAS